MPGAKEIRTKIKSVKSTQKITRAMEKVALSKMMRAQERLKATRPYVRKIREVIGHLAAASSDTVHPFMVERPVKRVAMIIVSSDRGLAGGLNSNLFRNVVRQLREYADQGVEVDYAVIGAKALGFFKRYGGRVVADAQKMGDAPKLESMLGLLSVVVDGYRSGTYDRVVLASNNFVNTMTQKPTLATLLPVAPIRVEAASQHWDYLYEPSADALLDQMLVRYVEAQVYGAVVENGASEQSARMVAMKAATDSAGKIIGSLQTAYNKARQAAITKEISEIVGGAAAV